VNSGDIFPFYMAQIARSFEVVAKPVTLYSWATSLEEEAGLSVGPVG